MGYLLSLDSIISIVKDLKGFQKTVATTNGCFDILHIGHLNYLKQASTFADILIVGINTDRSVSSIKGPLRPVNSELDRAHLVAGLQCVDYAFLFDEYTPDTFLNRIKPDIHIKGGDYSIDNLPEAATAKALGIDVKFIPFTEGHSTTDMIDKIKKLNA